MPGRQVWGYTVETDASGKNKWPIGLKKEAVGRIKTEGGTLGEIASELGAHENVVRKWLMADKKKNPSAFADVPAMFAEDTCAPDAPIQPAPSAVCRLMIGKLTLEFSASIPEHDLLKLVWVTSTEVV